MERVSLIVQPSLRRISSNPSEIWKIDQAYTHCSKAFLRSQLWDPARFLDRASLPSSGEIFKQLLGTDFDVATHDAERAARYARREGF